MSVYAGRSPNAAALTLDRVTLVGTGAGRDRRGRRLRDRAFDRRRRRPDADLDRPPATCSWAASRGRWSRAAGAARWRRRSPTRCSTWACRDRRPDRSLRQRTADGSTSSTGNLLSAILRLRRRRRRRLPPARRLAGDRHRRRGAAGRHGDRPRRRAAPGRRRSRRRRRGRRGRLRAPVEPDDDGSGGGRLGRRRRRRRRGRRQRRVDGRPVDRPCGCVPAPRRPRRAADRRRAAVGDESCGRSAPRLAIAP